MATTLPWDHGEAIPIPLVGRTHELAALRDRLAFAIGGSGSLVLLGGEAGIGKSALVERLVQEATAASCIVFTGHCYDLTTTPPYSPWQGLTASKSDGLPASLASSLAAMSGSSEVGGQTALFTGVRDGLATVATEQPVVIILEDMHWADPASLDFLRMLTRPPVALPLLFIVTYRADELTRRHPLYQLIPILVRESRAERIDLRRLDKAAIRTLVAAQYSLPDTNTLRLVTYLHDHAEGNPFYTRELLRTLEEEGVLQPSGDGWMLGDLSRVRVPSLVQQVIEGRVARLGDETRESLGLAAVIGHDVPLDLWSTLEGLSDEALLTTVERAVEAGLLIASERGTGVSFTHALVREALHDGILPPRRRIWHRKVAEVLAAMSGSDPDTVAYHFGQADDRRAWEWLVRAGERAQRSYAWLMAADRFAAAISVLEGQTEHARERGWLLYRLGRILRMSDAVKGVAYLTEAELVASAVGDPMLTAFATFDHGALLCFAGELARGIAMMEKGEAALAALTTTTPDRPEIAAWIADALPEMHHSPDRRAGDGESLMEISPRGGAIPMWLGFVGRFNEARVSAERYLTQSATTQTNEVVIASVSDAELGLGMALAASGSATAAREAFRRARAACLSIDHHLVAGMCTVWEIVDVVLPFQTTRTIERRRLDAEAAESLTRAAGVLPPGQWTKHLYVDVLLLDGAWLEAREIVSLAFDHADFSDRQFSSARLAQLARWQGDVELARASIAEAQPNGLATEPGNEFYGVAIWMQRLSAELAMDVGNLPHARTWIETYDRWISWSGAIRGQAEGHLLWARYERIRGNASSAERHAAEALAQATDPEQPLAQLAAYRLLGEIATDARRWTDADRHLQASLELADACEAPFERALTLLALAELREATGAQQQAKPLLDEVIAICTPLDARPTLSRAAELSSRLAAPTPTRHPARLSDREAEVLRLVAKGMTNAEIADALSISPRTVQQHLTNLYAKLDVTSRAGATRFAVEHGLT